MHVDLDATYVRLRAVRRVNLIIFSFGILQGFVLGFVIGQLT